MQVNGGKGGGILLVGFRKPKEAGTGWAGIEKMVAIFE